MLRLILILSLISVSSCTTSENYSNWKQAGCVRVTGDKPTYSLKEASDFELNNQKLSIQNKYLLGLMYGELSRTPDWTKSAYFIQKSAQAGYPAAQTALGKLYMNGTGVPKNAEEAYFWLRAGKSSNCDDVGVRIRSEKLLTPEVRSKVEKRLAEAGMPKTISVNWH